MSDLTSFLRTYGFPLGPHFFPFSLSLSNCRAESNRKIPPFSNFPTLEPKKRRGWVLLLLEAQIREEDEASEVLQLKIEKAPKILFSISESWKLGDKNGMFAAIGTTVVL